MTHVKVLLLVKPAIWAPCCWNPTLLKCTQLHPGDVWRPRKCHRWRIIFLPFILSAPGIERKIFPPLPHICQRVSPHVSRLFQGFLDNKQIHWNQWALRLFSHLAQGYLHCVYSHIVIYCCQERAHLCVGLQLLEGILGGVDQMCLCRSFQVSVLPWNYARLWFSRL